MKAAPFPARRHVLPGDNQDFLPETAGGSLCFNSPSHTGKARDTFFRCDCCKSSEKNCGD